MGMAKMYEDNLEIFLDRMYLVECRMKEQGVKIYYNSCSDSTKSEVAVSAKLSCVNDQAETLKDKYIVCKDCGKSFLFSAKTQKHFKLKGWEPPKRCKECRDFRNTRYLMVASF